MSRVWTNIYENGGVTIAVYTAPNGVRTVERWKLLGRHEGVLMERDGKFWPFPQEAVEAQLALGRTVVEGSVAKGQP